MIAPRYQAGELDRQLNNLIQLTTITSVDPVEKKVRVRLGADESADLPWPADQGANYVRWKPLKAGQQVIIASPSGDPAQGVIIGELFCDDYDTPSTDLDVDMIHFSNGSYIKHDIRTGILDFVGFADVLVNGISVPFHTHNKVRVGTDNTGMPQK